MSFAQDPTHLHNESKELVVQNGFVVLLGVVQPKRSNSLLTYLPFQPIPLPITEGNRRGVLNPEQRSFVVTSRDSILTTGKCSAAGFGTDVSSQQSMNALASQKTVALSPLLVMPFPSEDFGLRTGDQACF